MNRHALFCLLIAVGSSACATLPPLQQVSTSPYDTGDLTMLVRYTAKETCSCVFVMEQTDEFCRAFTAASPAVASSNIDHEAKTTSASALLLWSAEAHFVDDHVGCVLDNAN